MRLEAKDVNISISGKPIVQHLSIEVPDRKFSALLGANGSGKTTLLRSIYRTQKMDSGIVRLDDKDITHFSGKKLARNMAVMGQFNQINFDYTVLDIALMGRYPFHSLLEQERERDYEIALEALDKVGMKNYRDRNFQSLSGGEKQRVVLARALTQSPKILILDEPTNHLDIRYVPKNYSAQVYLQNGIREGEGHNNRLCDAYSYAQRVHTALQATCGAKTVLDDYGHHDRQSERLNAALRWVERVL